MGVDSRSGSIISKNWIITSENYHHPNIYIPSKYQVRSGVSFLNFDEQPNGMLHQVDKIVMYERPSNATGPEPLNWIVLMRVKEPFVFDETRQPIELFKAGEKSEPGTIAKITGYDLFCLSGHFSDSVLATAEVPIMDWNACNRTYNQYIDEKVVAASGLGIPEGHMCADYGAPESEQVSCLENLGGSLTVDGRLAGIISLQQPCMKEFVHNPKVFIDIAYYRDWIEQNVDQPLL